MKNLLSNPDLKEHSQMRKNKSIEMSGGKHETLKEKISRKGLSAYKFNSQADMENNYNYKA